MDELSSVTEVSLDSRVARPPAGAPEAGAGLPTTALVLAMA